MRHSRKGSLELSVNAIIILVMAIAVLGLGLAFIRGALTRGQEQVFKAIDNAELENPASADKIAVVDKNIDTKIGQDSPIRLGFYNTGTAQVQITPMLGDCIGSDASGVGVTLASGTDIVMSSGMQPVDPGKAAGFQGLIKPIPSSGAAIGTYICTVNFEDASSTVIGSAQFALHINS